MSATRAMPNEPELSGKVSVPPVPETLSDTGLSVDAVRDLILKTLYVQGGRTGNYLSEFLRLPFALVDEELLTLQQRRFVEVRSTTGYRASYLFDLVGAGRDRAKEALEACQYVGPAPVPLTQYREWIEAQSIRNAHVTQESLQAGFSHLVLNYSLLDMLGPAVNSSKSIFLYGHPGNGKTAIAEAISQMLGGVLYLPYAVDVDGQIMLVHDPVHHEDIETKDDAVGRDPLWLRSGPGHDRRFATVRRPVVVTGGELTLDQLDLRYDPFTKLYQAPFQVKANGGVLIVDDFGRQRVPPRDLLNRWIVPLEKRIDYLTLHTGGKFPVPFDCLLIFATNLDPAALVEEAFLRRIHYKIPVEDPTRAQYEEIFRRCCVAEGLSYQPDTVAYIFAEFYDRRAIPPRGCHPRDLIAHVGDISKYREITPQLTEELIDRACRSYFLESGGG